MLGEELPPTHEDSAAMAAAIAAAPAPQPALELAPLAPSRLDRAEVFRRVYAKVKRAFGGRLTYATVVILITDVMRAVEELSGEAALTGPEKKALAVDVVEVLVDELAPEDTKDMIQGAVNVLLPSIIDAIVSAAKGQTGLARAVRRSARWLFSCC